jgi:hypothetical protein
VRQLSERVAVLWPEEFYLQDIVRVRSRIVQDFLESDASHLLFVDSDTGFRPEAVLGMLQAGQDYVATPYPQKRIHFERLPECLLGHESEPPDARLYDYSVGFPKGQTPRFDSKKGTVEGISYCGLGLTLCTRGCLEKLVQYYGSDEALVFQDSSRPGAEPRLTVALFQPFVRDQQLLSEDYAFGVRWRDVGGTIHLYLGPGSPCAHAGEHLFVGHVEAFGLQRGRTT